MSVRSNGSGDKLQVNSALGIGTGNFTFAGWVKFSTIRAANVFFATDSDGGTNGEVGIYTTVDPSINGSSGGGTDPVWSSAPIPAVDTWYYLVLSRSGTGAGGFRLRAFDDSFSTTPIKDVTGTCAVDFTGVLSFYTLSEFFSGEWNDAEYVNHRVHVGVAWTDAEARAESLSYTPVTGGGTVYGNWKLKDTDADSDGINDSGGGGHNLTNTGFVNGVGTPSVLTIPAGSLVGAGGGGYAAWSEVPWATLPVAGAAVVLVADSGTYVITGQSATTVRTLLEAAGVGSYALTGQAATTLAGELTGAVAGVYVIDGMPLITQGQFFINAVAGVYTLAGSDINSFKGTVFGGANAGIYAITGFDLTTVVTAAAQLSADPGVYALTGQAAATLVAHLMNAAPGSYALTGMAITEVRGLLEQAGSGVYLIAGVDAIIFKGAQAGAGLALEFRLKQN
jgi:Concanavalin A-like lectin/glucanases superfamily